MENWRTQGEYTLFQANRFYRRDPPTAKQREILRPDGKHVPPAPKQPDMDFHAIVASYGEYPALLRQLGLVIDCVLPPDSPLDQRLAAGPGAQGLFWLMLRGDGAPAGGHTFAATCLLYTSPSPRD